METGKNTLDEAQLKALADGKQKVRLEITVDTWVENRDVLPDLQVLQDGCLLPYLKIKCIRDHSPDNWGHGVYH